MRQFLFPRRPLSRRTLIFSHLVIQLGLLMTGVAWLAPRTPWLAETAWSQAWPELILGISILLLAMVGARLLAELWLLPHFLVNQRAGFAPGEVITRSFDRRPAVHDTNDSWTGAARRHDVEDTVLGAARVTQPAASARRQRQSEPTLDMAANATPEPTPRHEPRL
ncbi:hypothetical protein L861_05715 [Litchfieldella anticariensis FP35 = DSM 16096]|uniref:Uncharacterized protein n=1 Tax=Litchfieldella anticariensis (strain DSM 16096 / CECT 5854 / CIP 108499 / LMG 22089 / FP35) TaxID=1121939 RepID=S2KKG0_LITA3|nr:hypothetical protein [Halomonas anticariensis]EPC00898.1 hypothetical protein L861_05715 [Halomonas anticariensis FP35 = DSM 16096]